MIRLRILGSPELHGQDGQVVVSVLSQPQRLTLLSYLTLTSVGTFTPREKLIRLFWPDSEPDRGRASLRTAVHGLRKSLGSEILTARGDDEVGIADGAVWCDVLEFEAAFAGGDLDAAWTLYGGGLLEHVAMPEAHELDRWLEDQRSRLHRKAFDVCGGLAERSEHEGDLRDALRWAAEAQSLEPLSEVGIRRRIRLLGLVGDRGAAVRVYDDFAARLLDELELAPSPETAELIESVRSDSHERSELVATAADTDQAPRKVAADAVSMAVPHGGLTAGGTREPPRPARRSYLGVATVALASVVIGVLLWGTTMASPVVGEGEQVILADFSDATGEGLGRVVTEALRVDLLASPVIRLVEAPDIQSTLGLMRGEGESELTAALAREVAVRDGIAAVIDGEVARAGSGYLLTATLRSAETGRSLASLRATANGPDDVIGAIDDLSRDLRRESGESLRAIEAGKPLAQVTTSSLDALKLYTEAAGVMRQRRPGRPPVGLLEEAVELDPEFAMAWRLLGVARYGDPAGRTEGHANAFRYRDRLPERERYLVEGTYYNGPGSDVLRAVEAYRNVLAIDPEEPAALNNLANILRGPLNDLTAAEELQRRAIASSRRGVLHYSTLLENLIHQGRVDDAADVLRAWQEALPGAAPSQNVLLLFVRGDLEEAARYALQVSEDPDGSPDDRSRSALALARVEYWRGHLDEARRQAARAAAVGAPGRPRVRWDAHLGAAYEEALAGESEWARAHFAETLRGVYLEMPVDGLHYAGAALRLVASGDVESAERVIRDWEENKPADRKGRTEIAQMTLASLHVRVLRGDTVGVMEAVQRLQRETECAGTCALFLEATLHDRVGDHVGAVERYERVLQPGYAGWGRNTGERLHAMMRLGPLYEELGDTTEAMAAYQRIVDQWAEGDARALDVVNRSRERISALTR